MKKDKEQDLIRSSVAEYLTYVATTGENGIELRYEDENIWLTQKMLSTLYGVSISAINQHIRTIYNDNELNENSTIKNFLIVQIVQGIFLKYLTTNSDKTLKLTRRSDY